MTPSAMSTEAPWLIVGAGAIGQLFAAYLAGHQTVVLLGRRPAAPTIFLRTPDGTDHQVALQRKRMNDWVGNDAPSLVVLATKAHDTQTALDALTPRIAPTTPLLLLQNGFWSQPRISEHWAGPVLCATTTEAAYRPMSGTDRNPPDVIHAAVGETWIGDLGNRHPILATTIAERLTTAGMSAAPCEDIRQRLWQKLAINAVINPLTAKHRICNGELAKPEFRPRIEALVSEISQILQAEGVSPPGAGWQGLIDGVIRSPAANRSSMLQDVLADRPTERDAILYPLIEAAARHGLDSPGIAALYQTTPR